LNDDLVSHNGFVVNYWFTTTRASICGIKVRMSGLLLRSEAVQEHVRGFFYTSLTSFGKTWEFRKEPEGRVF